MPKKTKKILEAHAKAAAEERYGVTLNKEARREIVQKIQTGDADFVSRTSNNRTLWKVDYQETSMNVVYDKSRHALVTFLPQNAREFVVLDKYESSITSRQTGMATARIPQQATSEEDPE